MLLVDGDGALCADLAGCDFRGGVAEDVALMIMTAIISNRTSWRVGRYWKALTATMLKKPRIVMSMPEPMTIRQNARPRFF